MGRAAVIVFVDWYGVLSVEPLWASIRRDPGHPLGGVLEALVTSTLADSAAAAAWMTGATGTRDVLAPLAARAAAVGVTVDGLVEAARVDCARMRPEPSLTAALEGLRAAGVTVVVATDNVDVFADAWRGRLFDGLACSSDVGCLKVDAGRFYGPWLAGGGFGDAVLVDDRADNCAAFEAAGGRAVRWGMGDPVGGVLACVGGDEVRAVRGIPACHA